MPYIRTRRGMSSDIENIIKFAKEKIILISPFFQIEKSLYERMKNADKNGIDITIVYGKEDLKNHQKIELEKLNNCQIFYLKNLHAKLYLNEKVGLIGSMNLYKYSEENNTEIGVFFEKRELENNLYKEALRESKIIIKTSILIKDKKENITTKKDEEIIKLFFKLKKGEIISNYPIQNIDIEKEKNSVSIISFFFKNKDRKWKDLKETDIKIFEEKLKGEYNVYWNNTKEKIRIYYDIKNSPNRSKKEKINLDSKAIKTIFNLLRKNFNEYL